LFPVAGKRRLDFENFNITSTIKIDPATITTNREDIPDSLFTINFPDEAMVTNAITGVVTKNKRIWNPTLEHLLKDPIEDMYLASDQLAPSAIDKEQESQEPQQPTYPSGTKPMVQEKPSEEPLSNIHLRLGLGIIVLVATLIIASIVWLVCKKT
jgi:hypothetical protein